jgi:TRAP transporter TAXI family solute receptor
MIGDFNRALLRVAFCAAFIAIAAFASNGPAASQELGLAAKKPIVAAACKLCPWGTVADVLKEALKPHGYDLQICYTCSRVNNPRYVTGDMKPPRSDTEGSPPPPDGPIDFGITAGYYVRDAYLGTLEYAGDAPRQNLRLIARVEIPNYAVIAVKASSGITDLHQIKDKHLPVRIITTENSGNLPILKYYGITRKELESWGGSFVPFVGTMPEDPDNFDVIIASAIYLGGAPEVRPYYLITARHDMRFLPMPEDLRDIMVKEVNMERVNMPTALFRGVDKPVPTVGTSARVVYGRHTLPADFAYTVAQALDERHDLMRWVHMPMSYDPRTVTQLPPVPLHPGAERYYREVGYLK